MRVVVYVPFAVPPRRRERYVEHCLTWCMTVTYDVVAVAGDPASAEAMMDRGEAENCVVGCTWHARDLDPAVVVTAPRRRGVVGGAGMILVPLAALAAVVERIREQRLVTAGLAGALALAGVVAGPAGEPAGVDPADPPAVAAPPPPVPVSAPAVTIGSRPLRRPVALAARPSPVAEVPTPVASGPPAAEGGSRTAAEPEDGHELESPRSTCLAVDLLQVHLSACVGGTAVAR